MDLESILHRVLQEPTPEALSDLAAEQRQALIQALLVPSLEAETPVSAKIALLGRLFQVLPLTHVLRTGL